MRKTHTKTWKAILGIITEFGMAALIMGLAFGIAWLITL